MARLPEGVDDFSRLQAVQKRVRDLATKHVWFAEALRKGFVDFLDLCEQHRAETAAMHERGRKLASEVLASGKLGDPACSAGRPALLVRVQGLCPAALATSLDDHEHGADLPVDLERDTAQAALKAMDRDAEYQSPELADRRAEGMAAEYNASIADGSHVEFTWRILVSHPDNGKEPFDPTSLSRQDLEGISDAEYMTIVLYRLGALADTGSMRPIVPKPGVAGDATSDSVAAVAWHNRFPIHAEDIRNDHPLPNPVVFPAEVAGQMLEEAEQWISEHPSSDDQSEGETDLSERSHPTDPIATTPRGQVTKPDGWTRGELINQAKEFDCRCSATTFDTIRKAAEVPPASKDGKGAQRRYSVAELRKLIAAVEAGRQRDKRKIAAAWRQLVRDSR